MKRFCMLLIVLMLVFYGASCTQDSEDVRQAKEYISAKALASERSALLKQLDDAVAMGKESNASYNPQAMADVIVETNAYITRNPNEDTGHIERDDIIYAAFLCSWWCADVNDSSKVIAEGLVRLATYTGNSIRGCSRVLFAVAKTMNKSASAIIDDLMQCAIFSKQYGFSIADIGVIHLSFYSHSVPISIFHDYLSSFIKLTKDSPQKSKLSDVVRDAMKAETLDQAVLTLGAAVFFQVPEAVLLFVARGLHWEDNQIDTITEDLELLQNS